MRDLIHIYVILILIFSDKKTGTLALIVELLDMNLYEVIKGMEIWELVQFIKAPVLIKCF